MKRKPFTNFTTQVREQNHKLEEIEQKNQALKSKSKAVRQMIIKLELKWVEIGCRVYCILSRYKLNYESLKEKSWLRRLGISRKEL